MPWAFLAVLVVLAVLNVIAVLAGTDMDGSKPRLMRVRRGV